MPLLKNGEVVVDPFVHVADDEALPTGGSIIVSLDRWQRERAALLAHQETQATTAKAQAHAIGVRFASDQSPAQVKDDLGQFAVCALDFPAFTDGRAYSYARLLRDRFGYEGEVRAIGNVLLEQLQFMARSGFDAFEIESDDAAREWKIAQADMDVFYQPTGDGRQTAMRRRQG